MLTPDYIKYLRHFGSTVTMAEMHSRPREKNMIGLRHDVDHDLDHALEMAYWEKEMGIRATYFLLPTAAYWKEAQFRNKALQIQDFGHEVGLHLNVISQWFKEGLEPENSIEHDLAYLRQAGLRITGVSTHGDRLCYEKHFINYWIFKELRPGLGCWKRLQQLLRGRVPGIPFCPNPEYAESGLSAEGIRTTDEKFQVIYPKDHVLTRQDGRTLPLWSLSMKSLGLEYHALHIPQDHYFTDSGDAWKRSPDPLQADLSQGRHQVLMHPEHWRGSQRIYFFLSTARAGSKWLAHILDLATPLRARHEFSLNHRYHKEGLFYEHNTGPGFTDLARDRKKARTLLLDIRTWIEDQGMDYGEANVYLERFLPLMQDIFPDAVLVHLYRDPVDVVRSIINRDWYDTPLDDRHPVMDVQGWDNMTRFEKVCWYVRQTSESLLRLENRIRFEDMTTDPDRMEKSLRQLGIAFYPRLAAKDFNQKINASRQNYYPGYENWPDELQSIYDHVLGFMSADLGYSYADPTPDSEKQKIGKDFYDLLARPDLDCKASLLEKVNFSERVAPDLAHTGCLLTHHPAGLNVVPKKSRHSFLLLAGGAWNKADEKSGWTSPPALYYSGSIRIDLHGSGSVNLFCLMYDEQGDLMKKQLLQTVRQDRQECRFAFRIQANAFRFNLALHMHKDDLPDGFVLQFFTLEAFGVKTTSQASSRLRTRSQ